MLLQEMKLKQEKREQRSCPQTVSCISIYIYWAAEEKIERRGRLPHGFFSPGPLQDVALTMLHFESNMLQINQALTI